jgi:hypothetical protein
MPKYKINISPSVYQIVDANNEEEAVKIVKAEIAKGAVSPIYDKLYFDYETGVPVKSLRRKLARAETAEEQEQLLQKIVGSDGFTRNTTGQLALTPKGLQELNLPYQSIKLQDGTEIRKNTIIDENKFNLSTGDLSDFMGVVGPIAGAIAAFSPQLRILKGVTSLLGNKKFAGRLLTSGLGTGGGKLGEEVVDALEGFQLQENVELAKLFGQEFLLGLGGQAIGEGVGLAFNKTIGAKEPTENLRLMFQGAKKRSIDDVKKLDEKLGKPATEKQIKQAIKDGEIAVFDTPFLVAQQTQGRFIPGRAQQIPETLFGSTRAEPSIGYLMSEVKKIGGLLNKEKSDLTSLVDATTGRSVKSTITDLTNNLNATEKELTKSLTGLVEDIANVTFKTGNYKTALGNREFGEELKNVLLSAKKQVTDEVGTDYRAVDEIFKNLTKIDETTQFPDDVIAESIGKAINFTIAKYSDEALNIVDSYKNSDVFWNINNPNGTIDSNVVSRAIEGLENLRDAATKYNPSLTTVRNEFNEPVKKMIGEGANFTQVRNAISRLRNLFTGLEEQFERDILYKVLRKLDDSDIGGSDSILTFFEKNGAREITKLLADPKLTARVQRGQFRGQPINLDEDEVNIINTAIGQLRRANEKNAARNQPFDNLIVKKAAAEAEQSGAFDADIIFDKVIYRGTKKDLEDIFDALGQYDAHLRIAGQGADANNLNYAKSQIKKRLFSDAFRMSTEFGEINFAKFSKYLKDFERTHPGKIDVLFTGTGRNTANLFKETINQLGRIDPRLRPKEVIKFLDDVFEEGTQQGLDGSQEGLIFIRKLRELANTAQQKEALAINKNISDLPNKPVDEIVSTIFRPRNGDNIRFLRNELDAQTMQSVQDAAFIKFLENSIDFGYTGKANIADIFKPGNLTTSLEKYGDDTLEAMFGRETTKSLKNLADTIDILTKGEAGRGAVAGGIVAAGIGASILFTPFAALPTIAGLLVARFMLSNPAIIKLFTKTDKGSIAQLLDAFGTAVNQVSARTIGTGIDMAREETQKLTEDILATEDAQRIQSEIRGDFRPQTNIILPEIDPIPSQPLSLDDQARIDYAERLFRRPVI